MTALVTPAAGREDDWLSLVAEFDGAHMDGSGFWGDWQPVLTSKGYAAYVAHVRDEGDDSVPAPPGRVKCTYYWITDDARGLVGFLALRRALTDFLLEQGGHIGYSVRPSRRREGHAATGSPPRDSPARNGRGIVCWTTESCRTIARWGSRAGRGAALHA